MPTSVSRSQQIVQDGTAVDTISAAIIIPTTERSEFGTILLARFVDAYESGEVTAADSPLIARNNPYGELWRGRGVVEELVTGAMRR